MARHFVFKNAETKEIENQYWAEDSVEGVDGKGKKIMIEDDIIPFLKTQGYEEVKNK